MASVQPAEWSMTKWSDAEQVLREIGDEDLVAAPGQRPADYCAALIVEGKLSEAATFLAHALPRFECVAWAARELIAQGIVARGDPLVTAALRWLDNPVDDNRRAAGRAAEAATEDTPARLLAQAIQLSGGSLSEPDLPAVLPPAHVCAKLAAAALVKGAFTRPEPQRVLSEIVVHGVALVQTGTLA